MRIGGNREPRRRKAGWRAFVRSALLVLLIAGPARAREVEVVLDDARGSCRAHGRFLVDAAPEVAWAVLADYDSLGRFVSSIRVSRLETQPDGRVLLRQDAIGGFFLIRRRLQVLLEIDEEPGRRIAFRDVLNKDFRAYAGEWRVTADSLGTRVDYRLEAVPRAAMDRAFCRGPLRGAARDLLTEVRAEMIRRATSGSTSPRKDTEP